MTLFILNKNYRLIYLVPFLNEDGFLDFFDAFVISNLGDQYDFDLKKWLIFAREKKKKIAREK